MSRLHQLYRHYVDYLYRCFTSFCQFLPTFYTYRYFYVDFIQIYTICWVAVCREPIEQKNGSRSPHYIYIILFEVVCEMLFNILWEAEPFIITVSVFTDIVKLIDFLAVKEVIIFCIVNNVTVFIDNLIHT